MARTVRVYLPELRAERRELPRDAAHYLTTVHRLRTGDGFVAFDPEAATEASATVTSVLRGRVECEIAAPRAACSGSFGVTLYQALSKGDRIEQVVRAGTALGVHAVVLVRTERSLDVDAAPRRERLRTIAIEAARQSGRGDVPELRAPLTFTQLLEEAPSLTAARYCLSPRAEVSLPTRLERWQPPSSVALLVGPEGGFADAELSAAEAAGFLPTALGPLTLRTVLAALVALGCFAARVPVARAE